MLGEVCRHAWAILELEGRGVLVRLRKTLLRHYKVHHAASAIPAAVVRWWLLRPGYILGDYTATGYVTEQRDETYTFKFASVALDPPQGCFETHF